jgi:hypothetical protein
VSSWVASYSDTWLRGSFSIIMVPVDTVHHLRNLCLEGVNSIWGVPLLGSL